MNRRILFTAAMFIALCGGPAARGEVTDEQVRAGIQEIIDLLYSEQNDQGHWDREIPENAVGHQGAQYGGKTALITYALLTAGESYQNPKLTRAIEFLKKVQMEGVYAVSCRAHVWASLPPELFATYLQRDVRWLLQAQHPTKGHYNYTIEPTESYDNSVTQYGVLGVWEGAKHDQPISRAYWARAEQHFLETQHDNGGWDYRTGSGVRGSMTAAGLAVLYITQDYLHSQDYRTFGSADEHPLQHRINMGLAWFAKNFEADTNPGIGHYVHYYLYGVERVGLASGVKYFAGQDWYAAGAEYLLKHHGQDTDAAFSLLFLVRGGVPVLINKLRVPGYNWNNRPRDLAQLAQWVSDEVEQNMNWQIVSFQVPSEDWLDAPILYFAGHEAFSFTEEQTAKLKRFIDLGGMLITTADGASQTFTRSVEELLGEMYPRYQLQPLADDDELLNIVFKMGGNRLNVQTLHNGIRHLALHIPRDVSWDLHSSSHADPVPWHFFTNAYYYATEKGRTRNRLDDHFIARQEGKGDGAPAVTVGRGTHAGNFNPEPAAWEVQSNFMYNAGKADVTLKPIDLAELSAQTDVPLVHVVGTGEMEFSDSQIEAIRQYVGSGGVVFFENAGGRGDFSQSVMNMLGEAYPQNRISPINLQSPIITGEGIGGYDVSSVDYRPYMLLKMGPTDTPRLMAVTFDGQPRILLSGEDLTEAMLDQPVWGVFGYSTDSAQKIMTNIVLWAQKISRETQGKPAP